MITSKVSPYRLLKNAQQSRAPRESLILPRVKHGAGLLQRTSHYTSFLMISGAPVNGISQTQLASACRSLSAGRGIFDQPEKNEFSNWLFSFAPQCRRTPRLSPGKLPTIDKPVDQAYHDGSADDVS